MTRSYCSRQALGIACDAWLQLPVEPKGEHLPKGYTMSINTSKIASSAAAFYVIFILGGIFVHYFITGEAYTLRYSLTLPSVWAASLVGLAIAWGLWNQFNWAWWLGLAGASYMLLRVIWRILEFLSQGIPMKLGVITVLILMLGFLIILLLPTTRRQCVR